MGGSVPPAEAELEQFAGVGQPLALERGAEEGAREFDGEAAWKLALEAGGELAGVLVVLGEGELGGEGEPLGVAGADEGAAGGEHQLQWQTDGGLGFESMADLGEAGERRVDEAEAVGGAEANGAAPAPGEAEAAAQVAAGGEAIDREEGGVGIEAAPGEVTGEGDAVAGGEGQRDLDGGGGGAGGEGGVGEPEGAGEGAIEAEAKRAEGGGGAEGGGELLPAAAAGAGAAVAGAGAEAGEGLPGEELFEFEGGALGEEVALRLEGIGAHAQLVATAGFELVGGGGASFEEELGGEERLGAAFGADLTAGLGIDAAGESALEADAVGRGGAAAEEEERTDERAEHGRARRRRRVRPARQGRASRCSRPVWGVAPMRRARLAKGRMVPSAPASPVRSAMSLLPRRTVLLGLAGATFALAGCGDLVTFDVKIAGSSKVDGSPFGALFSVFPLASSFNSFDLSQTQDFKNQGVAKGDVKSVKLGTLTLRIASPSGQDFGFLDELEFFAEAEGLAKKRVAHKSGIAQLGLKAPNPVLTLDLDDAELEPYVSAAKMSITTTVKGRQPNQDTTLEVAAVFKVTVI